MPNLDIGFGTPFQAQIDTLRQKLNLPTKRWDDIQAAAHDKAFVVAGAAKADLLNDLHTAITAHAESGKGLAAFARDFKQIVAKNGWTGWTGEGTPEGEAWRAKIIYQTNMASSYAAGRWRQLNEPAMLAALPAWRYIHMDGQLHPRPEHAQWHGLTLPADHPFWLTHFAPNGWHCHCRIVAVTQKEYERSLKAGLGEPPEGWDKIDPNTNAPVGIDKGFAYAPGANVDTPLRKMVQDKLITYPDAISKALTFEVNRYINAKQAAGDFAQRVILDTAVKEPLWVGFVENYDALNKLVQTDVRGYTVLIPADAPRHISTSHEFDGGTQRPPVAADFNQVASVLNGADTLVAGNLSRNKNETVVAKKLIGSELFTAVFEVLAGKKSYRALVLNTMWIKV